MGHEGAVERHTRGRAPHPGDLESGIRQVQPPQREADGREDRGEAVGCPGRRRPQRTAERGCEAAKERDAQALTQEAITPSSYRWIELVDVRLDNEAPPGAEPTGGRPSGAAGPATWRSWPRCDAPCPYEMTRGLSVSFASYDASGQVSLAAMGVANGTALSLNHLAKLSIMAFAGEISS